MFVVLQDALSRAFMGPDAHPTGVLAAIELAALLTGVSDTWVNPSAQVQAIGTGRSRNTTALFETQRVRAEDVTANHTGSTRHWAIPEDRFGTRHPIRARYL